MFGLQEQQTFHASSAAGRRRWHEMTDNAWPAIAAAANINKDAAWLARNLLHFLSHAPKFCFIDDHGVARSRMCLASKRHGQENCK